MPEEMGAPSLGGKSEPSTTIRVYQANSARIADLALAHAERRCQVATPPHTNARPVSTSPTSPMFARLISCSAASSASDSGV